MSTIAVLTLAYAQLGQPLLASSHHTSPAKKVARVRTVAKPQWKVPKRYRGKLVCTRPKGFDEKVIALTFDDGPDPKNTLKVLRILGKRRAKATFFVMGLRARAYPNLMRTINALGHVVGSHSYTHPAYPTLARANVELDRTAKVIKNVLGRSPTVFRPTYGITKNWLSHRAGDKGYAVVTWTNLSNDTQVKSVPKVVKNVLGTVRPGDIVLMHDGYLQARSSEALPEIMDKLIADGYQFVTVPEMLDRYAAFLAAKPAKGKGKLGDAGQKR